MGIVPPSAPMAERSEADDETRTKKRKKREEKRKVREEKGKRGQRRKREKQKGQARPQALERQLINAAEGRLPSRQQAGAAEAEEEVATANNRNKENVQRWPTGN